MIRLKQPPAAIFMKHSHFSVLKNHTHNDPVASDDNGADLNISSDYFVRKLA